MLYLSKEQLIDLNKVLYEQFGGAYTPPFNFQNEASLDYLIGIVENDDYYPTLFEKAACYVFIISSRHVFADGNKRTATFAGINFLELNSFRLTDSIDDKQLIEFALNVAKGEIDQDGVTKWLSENSEEILPEDPDSYLGDE